MEEENVVDSSQGEKQGLTRKEQNQRNIENNEDSLRAFADFTKDKGWGWVSAAGQAIDKADKISGGRSTKHLAKKVNRINKAVPGGRRAQKLINRQAEKGVTKKYNQYKDLKEGNFGNHNGDQKFKGTITTEKKQKPNIMIYIIAAIVIVALASITIFVVMFTGDSMRGGAGSGGAEYEYGKTCTKITVENTGCDENGENCTYEHDGEVEFEDYIAGVIAAEADGSNNLEYYKLLATTTRTYLHENAPDDCIVDGNDSFKPYVDINTSTDAELIKQAVTDTENKIVIKDDKLTDVEYCEACVVNADDNNYYIRYGSDSSDEAKLQPIPKSWDSESHPYTGKLSTLYSQVDQSVPDYNDRDCPNNDDSGMSEIGAYYLTSQGGYTYEGVIKYYYGPEVEIVENSMQLSGVDGFLNPTGKIYCSSPYGPRIHPVKGGASNHSGIDIAIPGGEPIYAANDGIITYVQKGITGINDCDYGYGNYIVIDHGDGMSTLYAHIKYDSIPDSIETGAMVRQGEQIGQIGSTGCSTGNHLHYEVKQNNQTVDPADYLDLTKASGTCRR